MPKEMMPEIGKQPIPPLDKLYSVDYARGVAVLLVASGHFFDLNPSSYAVVNDIRRAVSFSGLPLFFVLSGFLLSRQMTLYRIRYGNSDQVRGWIRFFINRFLRIYPAYLLSLLVLTFVGRHSVSDVTVHILNVHNLYADYILSINPVYWTLAVEFQWYLAFPLLFPLFSWREGRYQKVALLSLFLAIGFFWRQFFIQLYRNGLISYDRLFLFGHGQLISHLFAFCLGIVLFHYSQKRKYQETCAVSQVLTAGVIFSFLGGLITVQGLDNPDFFCGIPLNLGTLFLLPCGAAGILYFMLLNEEKIRRAQKNIDVMMIRWIGTISYSLYLWHYPVFLKVNRGTGSMVVDMFISFGVAFILSWVSYFFIERYFMRFKTVFGAWLTGEVSNRKPAIESIELLKDE